MNYVYDASFVGALIIPDEYDPHIFELNRRVAKGETIFVPQLFWYEMGNIFRNLILRKRYSYKDTLQLVSTLAKTSLAGDSAGGDVHYAETLLRIAHDYNLTAYDAAYLELAGRKKALLGTLDDNLRAVADDYGVELLG
jgi:predicted nucleic acid-binding protein